LVQSFLLLRSEEKQQVTTIKGNTFVSLFKIHEFRQEMKSSSHIWFFCCFLLTGCIGQQLGSSQPNPPPLYVNALELEGSPYLREQAYQPIFWRGWSQEALGLAADQDRLLVVSIGYQASYWCRLMDEDVFADTAVARLMNESFMAIKVDREERPDLDGWYQRACELLRGEDCGWPLQVIALPDGRPIATARIEEPGDWIDFLDSYRDLYREHPEHCERIAEQVYESIKLGDSLLRKPVSTALREGELSELSRRITQNMDPIWGGLQEVPKYPRPVLQHHLLRQAARTGDEYLLKGVEVSLDAMARGAIYDHIGGGFFYIATDQAWRKPEFEKMLYDNAQLLSLYADAYRMTKDARYEKILYETVAFLQRELQGDWGYYSSLASVSEGVEGRYYLWSPIDLEVELAGKAELFSRYYNLTEEGNWSAGQNIPYERFSDQRLAVAYRMDLARFQEEIAQGREALFAERSQRVLPTQDKKEIIAWNALLIQGLIRAYRAVGEEDWLEAAKDLAESIRSSCVEPNFHLPRYRLAGEFYGDGFLDDYTQLAQAALDLYEVSFEERWIDLAEGLTLYARGQFRDDGSGFCYYAPSLMSPVIGRWLELTDTSLPASNATFCQVLLRLAELRGEFVYREEALRMMSQLQPAVAQSPIAHVSWMEVLSQDQFPKYQILLQGPDAKKYREELDTYYLPQVRFQGSLGRSNLPALANKQLLPGRTRLYLCPDGTCLDPVETIPELLSLLEKN
jgi:hypothetical protein